MSGTIEGDFFRANTSPNTNTSASDVASKVLGTFSLKDSGGIRVFGGIRGNVAP